MTNKISESPPASVAIQYFAEQEAKKAREMEAFRAQVKDKAPTVLLPVDYFQKEGEAVLKKRAQAAKDFAESQMPIAVKKFTAKAELEQSIRANGTVSDESTPVAMKYFNKKAAEKGAQKNKILAVPKGEELMPAAIQKFTLAARRENMKKAMALEELKNNPAEVPAGVAHFSPVV